MTKQTNIPGNPLAQFYRVEKTRVRLPSRGIFYEPGVVDLSPENEVGVKPMTAADELLLKNPDALLSGQALLDVIKSCVPAVKQPNKLLTCDIDTLMIAIRDASYGDDLTVSINCPACNHENTYGMNLDILLNQTEELAESYTVDLGEGLQVYVKPSTFNAVIKRQKVLLDQRKVERVLKQENVTEEERLTMVSTLFSKLGALNYELITDGVQKIQFKDSDHNTVTVTEKNHIHEYIRNIDREQVDRIETKLREVNKVGVATTMPAVCTSCGHRWEAPIDFNPINFS